MVLPWILQIEQFFEIDSTLYIPKVILSLNLWHFDLKLYRCLSVNIVRHVKFWMGLYIGFLWYFLDHCYIQYDQFYTVHEPHLDVYQSSINNAVKRIIMPVWFGNPEYQNDEVKITVQKKKKRFYLEKTQKHLAQFHLIMNISQDSLQSDLNCSRYRVYYHFHISNYKFNKHILHESPQNLNLLNLQ